MIVECSACSTIFPVDPLKIPTGGIHARCSVCSEVFFVSVPDTEVETPSPAIAELPDVDETSEAALPEPEAEEVQEDEAIPDAEPEFGMEEVETDFPISYDTDEPVEDPETEPVEEPVAVVEEPVAVVEEVEAAVEEDETVFQTGERTFPADEVLLAEEEPAPVFEGAEATFQTADAVVDDATEEVVEEMTEKLDSEASLLMDEAETGVSGVAEEMATGFQEPTFGAMDDIGTETPPVAAPLFGKRDPMEKAQRLARVLVSDIILYNPDRHHSATESGRVKEEFEEEIQKSWNEYVEQVGEDVANTTSYFNDALNEILAKGEQIF